MTTFGFGLFWRFGYHLLTYKPSCLSITDEGSVSEMRICFILFIRPDLKCCVRPSLFYTS